jgi:hypothetical protein
LTSAYLAGASYETGVGSGTVGETVGVRLAAGAPVQPAVASRQATMARARSELNSALMGTSLGFEVMASLEAVIQILC